MIPVTKSFLPPFEKFTSQLERVYEKQWLTNRGSLVKELECKLINHLGVTNIIAMTNGTLPIQIALKLLANGGEVITTPFSYVATTSALVWENCTPVFVDIHPEYLTIDETKIEAAITPKTTCILATHVYGNPCDVEEIERIAQKHNLRVIYDAAHCFGVNFKDISIFEYGDVSTCSFHATKLFHTGEGGAIFCKDEKINQELFNLHNFGHQGHLEFGSLGINAKMSELQGAMGLSVLPHMSEIINARKKITDVYDSLLDFNKLRKLSIRKQTQWNYSYYPIIFSSEKVLLGVESKLKEQNIVARRYFYPALNHLPYVNKVKMAVSDDISPRVLCLPLYHELELENVELIINIINKNI